jgi:hypothetical protein
MVLGRSLIAAQRTPFLLSPRPCRQLSSMRQLFAPDWRGPRSLDIPSFVVTPAIIGIAQAALRAYSMRSLARTAAD